MTPQATQLLQQSADRLSVGLALQADAPEDFLRQALQRLQQGMALAPLNLRRPPLERAARRLHEGLQGGGQAPDYWQASLEKLQQGLIGEQALPAAWQDEGELLPEEDFSMPPPAAPATPPAPAEAKPAAAEAAPAAPQAAAPEPVQEPAAEYPATLPPAVTEAARAAQFLALTTMENALVEALATPVAEPVAETAAPIPAPVEAAQEPEAAPAPEPIKPPVAAAGLAETWRQNSLRREAADFFASLPWSGGGMESGEMEIHIAPAAAATVPEAQNPLLAATRMALAEAEKAAAPVSAAAPMADWHGVAVEEFFHALPWGGVA